MVSTAVAVPPGGSGTLDGLRVETEFGAELAVSVTVPLNPLRLVRVIVELTQEPCWMLKLAGLANIEKSGEADPVTVTVSVTEWDVPIEELVPVTVTA
jgi:hypothetical protein